MMFPTDATFQEPHRPLAHNGSHSGTSGGAPPFDPFAACLTQLAWLHPDPTEVIELRALRVQDGRRTIPAVTGYFSNRNLLAQNAMALSGKCGGVYATVQEINPALLARSADRVQLSGSCSATPDSEVKHYRNLLIDIDPTRPADISSTDAEWNAAFQTANLICQALAGEGWPAPLVISSGNGIALYYALAPLPVAEGKPLVERILALLDSSFSSPAAHVDRKVGNPARISRLAGTLNMKGDSIEARPHRLATFLPGMPVPPRVEVTRAQLEALLSKYAPAAPAESGPVPDQDEWLERWLDDFSVSVSGPTSYKGGDKWVLAECPFNPAHKAPDACLYRKSDGPLAFRCSHDSCGEFGWKEFRQAIEEASPEVANSRSKKRKKKASKKDESEAAPTDDDTDPRPRIIVNQEEPARFIRDIWGHIHSSNSPPWMFQHAGHPATIIPETIDAATDGVRASLAASPYTPSTLAVRLSDLVRFSVQHFSKGTVTYVTVAPPENILAKMLEAPVNGLPLLNRLASYPLVTADGRILQESGYDSKSGLFYQKSTRVEIPPIHPNPPPEHIAVAKSWLLDTLLVDFPFDGVAKHSADYCGQVRPSFAHAVAMLAESFLRPLIKGPTPLYVISKPIHGSGATLLCECLDLILHGSISSKIPETEDNEEWRKRITSLLLAGRSMIFIDNVNEHLDASTLAAALTTESWSDRILGRSEMVSLPAKVLWVATANNISASPELTDRMIPCFLDPKCDRPRSRPTSDFVIPHLQDWCRENRGTLIWSIMTLISAWLAAGAPKSHRKTKGSFIGWSTVMGGFLEFHGIEGFLENLEELYSRTDTESESWRMLLLTWWAKHREQPASISDVLEIVTKEEISGLRLNGGTDLGRVQSLGRHLSRQTGRHWNLVDGDHRWVVKLEATTKHGGTRKIRLTLVSGNPPSSPTYAQLNPWMSGPPPGHK